ncbi:putative iron(III)/siderophore ABC transporter substrate-binding protein [Actinoplanes missouriensis 431]|uniref:Putative iron(III)/siderophore ABC transporter substrate-binding protein n=1 Tax=Actinoplanes missouriensis (strain ATCC 14538 / DSM 43046 / CBS 188.64 / JCM 3121 / NBRC 102363 / NCIMB 12654 / NRRL B-3342 / UNCC 431) TaxID=512565 RepID=I0HBX3_ACTM4|nr:iron-siderophore ABC transporter substrate-binding protein [Actinoplanes missouriensis]BAL90510.1 putative iron(III)/siderophore ABC transporter substrate-binding protein [Actinoplanes missouriensis 431]
MNRVLTSLLALTLTAGALAACGSSDDETATPDAGSSGAAAGAFPVTVTHKLGTTTLEKSPERIVALSDADIDALLLLGIQPVGIAQSVAEGGINPWAKPKITGTPVQLVMGETGVDPEEVAKLNPDLVLAGGDYYIDQEYKALSPLVPTTAYETGPFEDPWQTTLRQVAKLVGKVDQGEQIITDVQAKVDGVKTQHPALAGKTFTISQVFEAGTIGVLRSGSDVTVKAFNDLGMKLAPAVAALPGDEFAVTLSLEKIATIDADVMLIYYTEPQLKTALEANTLFKNLPAVKGGKYIALGADEFMALRNPSPLSVPYFIDNTVPAVAKAAGA